MPTVYRILHKPTGLYFCPSRDIKLTLQDGDKPTHRVVHVKSNLSKVGKTYLKKPSLTYVGQVYYTHLITNIRALNPRQHGCLLPFVQDEWQIVEVT